MALVQFFVVQTLLASFRAVSYKTSVVRSEVNVIRESNRTQFSVRTLLGAITLSSLVFIGVFRWHHWALRNSEPYGDPSEQWFIDSRQQMYDWTTPCISVFMLVAAFAIWYSVANRKNLESLTGGLCLIFPVLFPLGPLSLLSVLIPLVTPIMGCWLLFRRRFLLGAFVILFAAIWLYFAFLYIDECFEIYGD